MVLKSEKKMCLSLFYVDNSDIPAFLC